MILSAYMSHSIRGPYGDAATATQIAENCCRAIRVADMIRRDMKLDLYVPAQNDEFVQLAYKAGRLTERDILLTDCEIIAKRDILLAWDPSGRMESKGMLVEVEHALAIGVPVFIFHTWDRDTWSRLEWFLLKGYKLCGQGSYALHPQDYRLKGN